MAGLQDIGSLLPVQRRLAALSHDEPKELRDLGLLCAQTNRLGEAFDPLQAYLETFAVGRRRRTKSVPWSKPSAARWPGGIESARRSGLAIRVARNSAKVGAEIQESGHDRPILSDTALAERERAGVDDKATGSASWLMWGNDQDDRPFVLVSLPRVTTHRPDQEEIATCASKDRHFAS